MFFALSLLIGGLLFAQSPDQEVVIKVNETPITAKEVTDQTNSLLYSFLQRGQQVPQEHMGILRKQAADSLIQMVLLEGLAKKAGFTATREEVNQKLEAMKKQFPDEETFKKALKGQSMTVVDLRRNLRKNLMMDKYVESIKKSISVDEKDIQAFYNENPQKFQHKEQVKARHILIKVDAKADEATQKKARKKAEEALQRVKKGEDFAKVAREVSEGPSKTQGGDLGYFSKGQMVPPFEEAAFKLKVGEISNIVQTRFGYHIIQVTDRRPAGKTPLKEVEGPIKDYLLRQKLKEKVMEILEKERGKAKIEYKDVSLKPQETKKETQAPKP